MSDSEEEEDDSSDNVLYEVASRRGNALGTAKLIPCAAGEFVHGHRLSEDERKIVVVERYLTLDDSDPESDEFLKGTFLSICSLQLRKLPYRSDDKKRKKGRGPKKGISPKKWNRKKNKDCRNKGISYVNVTGKAIPSKEFNSTFTCSCRYKSCDKLTDEEKKNCFTEFWRIGDFTLQNALLLKNVQSKPKASTKKVKEGVASKVREMARSYKINDKDVCKGLFVATYGISNGRLGRVLKRYDNDSSHMPIDGRGKGSKAVVAPEVTECLVETIEKFPKYISHYGRSKDKNDNTIYLAPDTTFESIYDHFAEELSLRGLKVPSKTWFGTTMNTKYPHVKIKHPGQDTCNKCSELTLLDKKEELQTHQEKAAVVMEKMKEDFKDDCCITFDLQAVQPLPLLRVNKAFYKRKTWLYNLGIHATASDNGCMYVWNETIGKRGAREISSCLYQYIMKNFNDPTKDHIILYSDSCTGQNRNYIISVLMLRLLSDLPHLKYIIHRFPEPGHSFLPNDRDFGQIEKLIKKKDAIYVPAEYVEIMKKARKSPSPFDVVDMTTSDFVDVSRGVNFKNLSHPVDNDGEPFNWFHIHEFLYEKDSFGFKFKYNLTDNYRTCFYGAAKRRGRPNEPIFNESPIRFPNGIPLKKAKYNDLQELLAYIPPVHHHFFESLPTDNTANTANNDSEDEFEEL